MNKQTTIFPSCTEQVRFNLGRRRGAIGNAVLHSPQGQGQPGGGDDLGQAGGGFTIESSKTGRPRTWLFHKLINAILYVTKTGCQWRMLPADFPPWQTVYYHFNKRCKNGVWKKINDVLTREDRKKSSRDPSPSAGIIDNQSVKTAEVGGPQGYDAGKKVSGRKRHILVDVGGRISRSCNC